MNKFKKTEKGRYEGFAFFGYFATIFNADDGWCWILREGRKGDVITSGYDKTKRGCEADIAEYGRNTKTTVKSIMGNGKEIEMSIADVGGPCDPSTERYWSM